jgi:hypothetical protein
MTRRDELPPPQRWRGDRAARRQYVLAHGKQMRATFYKRWLSSRLVGQIVAVSLSGRQSALGGQDVIDIRTK